MSYVVYSSKASGGFVVEAALAKAGAKYEAIMLDTSKGEHQTAEFTAINPMQQVPALKLPDGTLMTESAAMVIHLANVFPDKGLAPAVATAAHAGFLRWMVFMAASIYESDLRFFYSDRYTTDPKGADGVKSAAAQRMLRSFGIIEEAIGKGPFLCGKTMSIADAYLAMLSTWSPEPLKMPRIARISAEVAADKHYGPVWTSHGMGG